MQAFRFIVAIKSEFRCLFFPPVTSLKEYRERLTWAS